MVKMLQRKGASFGLKFSMEDVTAVNIKHTATSVMTAVWMENFFNLTGDQIPNSNGQIHLEKQERKSIYNEYAEDSKYFGRKYLTYSQFLDMWKRCFSHVKIRVYKQVTGTIKIIYIP
jgi:hypothetical protein